MLLSVAMLTMVMTAQEPSLTLLSREGRRAIPVTSAGGTDFVSLDELAAVFQLTYREESGALTVSYKGKTIVLTADQALASIAGRLVSLPARPMRSGGKWLVPVDFVNRAFALVYESKLDLHRPSRLLVIGDLRVPRVTVRHEPLGPSARVTIDATPRTSTTVAQDGQRLVVRFDADALDSALPDVQSQGFVTGIRAIDNSTIGIDLGQRFGSFKVSSSDIDTTTRVVIDITGAQETTSAPAPPSPPELPVLGQPVSTIRTVVIDPGHGGADVGSRGAGGATEKDVALAVARRLKSAIETRLGIRVILTRDDDREMAVDDRAAVANNNKADLFISLHANASPRPSLRGASIYTAAFDPAAVAERPSPERVNVYGGGFRDIEIVPWNVAQLRFLAKSTDAAHLLEERLQGRVPLTTPAVGTAPLRVLESANMPAVLIEMGFLSNPEQEKQLVNADFQTTIAQAIVDTIVSLRDALAGNEGAEH
ncbi:MAG TPA: N-acetylmuramoyl-L-alanine amidase [Vicinamibacterales bacterium]|nr:N-acetylmuramoyl-L-alanine amidase [Vicinamibacterales bacterium]